MLIHAFKRKEPTPVELFGLKLVFTPNAAGHCVADVSKPEAVERLLGIPEAFREYEAEPSAEPKAETPAEPDVSLVLQSEDGETIDLSTFTAKRVREFAAEAGVTLPAGNSTPVAELRQLLARALTAQKA